MMAPRLAEIMELPGATPEARPVAAPMTAADRFDEFQVTRLVMFCLDPLLYAPVALNCKVELVIMELDGAVIEIEVRAAGVTVNAKRFDVTPFRVAVIFVAP